MQIPSWVEYEIQNWARMHWVGSMPGPRRIGQEARQCMYPFQDVEEDEPGYETVNYERAQQVEGIYQKLPHEDRRVLHAEYTRVKEYGNMPDHIRAAVASKKIGITVSYYKLALLSFRKKVWGAFK
ncbi:MAG: hypothetical protein ACTJHW_15840 [Paenalcaligenes sp.]|uniref:hypothetical protein n=1 Tax=Paenalcaligenes suwonensis TaxID=1202713 RepID=UPI001408C769|nr:hypothetical protein [Paenalcaligenes suwonensis]NHC63089.1 hypothetical protein [Paenalcaligenes suwonensis]